MTSHAVRRRRRSTVRDRRSRRAGHGVAPPSGSRRRHVTTVRSPRCSTATSSHRRRTMPSPRPDSGERRRRLPLVDRRDGVGRTRRWTTAARRRRTRRPRRARRSARRSRRGWMMALVTSSLVTSSMSSTTVDGDAVVGEVVRRRRGGRWRPASARAGTSSRAESASTATVPSVAPIDASRSPRVMGDVFPVLARTKRSVRRRPAAPRSAWYEVAMHRGDAEPAVTARPTALLDRLDALPAAPPRRSACRSPCPSASASTAAAGSRRPSPTTPSSACSRCCWCSSRSSASCSRTTRELRDDLVDGALGQIPVIGSQLADDQSRCPAAAGCSSSASPPPCGPGWAPSAPLQHGARRAVATSPMHQRANVVRHEAAAGARLPRRCSALGLGRVDAAVQPGDAVRPRLGRRRASGSLATFVVDAALLLMMFTVLPAQRRPCASCCPASSSAASASSCCSSSAASSCAASSPAPATPTARSPSSSPCSAGSTSSAGSCCSSAELNVRARRATSARAGCWPARAATDADRRATDARRAAHPARPAARLRREHRRPGGDGRRSAGRRTTGEPHRRAVTTRQLGDVEVTGEAADLEQALDGGARASAARARARRRARPGGPRRGPAAPTSR